MQFINVLLKKFAYHVAINILASLCNKWKKLALWLNYSLLVYNYIIKYYIITCKK